MTHFPQTAFGLNEGERMRAVITATQVDLTEALDFELDVLATVCEQMFPLYGSTTSAVHRAEDLVANEKARRLRARRVAMAS